MLLLSGGGSLLPRTERAYSLRMCCLLPNSHSFSDMVAAAEDGLLSAVSLNVFLFSVHHSRPSYSFALAYINDLSHSNCQQKTTKIVFPEFCKDPLCIHLLSIHIVHLCLFYCFDLCLICQGVAV